MAAFLLDQEANDLPRVVFHPEQVAAASYIARLLGELRDAGSDTDAWYDFEARLFRARYRADEAYGRIKRSLKRVRALKGPDWRGSPSDFETSEFVMPLWQLTCASDSSATDEWELEVLVAQRVSRQLASVGDVLAWRVFRYDRSVITALSTNQPSGPFVGREGLPYEVSAILERRERGNFCLMHDLTSVIRHVDITEVHPNGYRELHEIKASRVASGSRQLKAGRVALDAVTGLAPLPGGSKDRYLHRVSVPFRTTLRRLDGAITIARRDGIYLDFHADRVITVFDAARVASQGLKQTVEEHVAAHDSKLQQQWPGSSVFRAYSGDKAAREPSSIPYGLYPLSASDCADLICDQLLIVASISSAALEQALERRGAEVRFVIRAEDGRNIDGEMPVIMIRRGSRRMAIPMGAISQLLSEFIETKRWAEAIWELFETSEQTHNVLTFSNERGELR